MQLGEKNGAAEYGKFSSLVSDLPVLPAEKAAASEMPEQRPSGAVPAQRGLQQKIRGFQELRVANSLRLRCLGRFLAANCCSVCNIPHTGNFSGWHLITSSDFIAFLLLYLYRATLISYHAIWLPSASDFSGNNNSSVGPFLWANQKHVLYNQPPHDIWHEASESVLFRFQLIFFSFSFCFIHMLHKFLFDFFYFQYSLAFPCQLCSKRWLSLLLYAVQNMFQGEATGFDLLICFPLQA